MTIEVEKDPLYKERLKRGLEQGLEKGLEEAKKEDAISLYEELKLPIETFARVLKVEPQKVEEWLKEANLLEGNI